MNKLFNKIATITLGLAMAIGVGVAIGANKEAIHAEAASGTFTKITSAPSDWSGEYVIVYESSSTAYCWTGVDAASCYATATISSGSITGPANACTVTIATMTGGYSVKVNGGTNNGKYIKNASNNGIVFQTDAAATTFTYENNSVTMTCGGKNFRYNSNSDQKRFRYFGSAQQVIQLYKKASSKTLSSIAVSNQKTAYVVGESFTTPTVTATYSDASTANVTTSTTFTGFDSSSATQSQTITASYTEGGVTKTDTYTISIAARVLTSITLSGQTTDYSVGDTFSFTGTCTAHYSNAVDATVTPTSVSSPDMSSSGTKTINVSYTESGVTKTATYDITVSTTVTDVIDYALTGISGTGYKDWSGKSDASDAVYAGQSNAGVSYVQIRNTNPSGIVCTSSGGKAKKVKVTWGGSNTNGRVVTIYGKNAAYSAPADLYDDSKKGTSAGTVTYSTGASSASVNLTGDYEYIGIRSNGAAYMTKIEIVWDAATKSVTGLSSVSDASGKTWYSGDTLNNSDLSVTVTYDSGDPAVVTDGTGVYFNSAHTQTTLTLSQGTNNVVVYYSDVYGTADNSSNPLQITAGAERNLSSIAVTTAPSKTSYVSGESFDSDGMVVTATFTAGPTADVTSECTFTPSGALTVLNTSITISYTYKTTTKTTTQAITVTTSPTTITITGAGSSGTTNWKPTSSGSTFVDSSGNTATLTTDVPTAGWSGSGTPYQIGANDSGGTVKHGTWLLITIPLSTRSGVTAAGIRYCSNGSTTVESLIYGDTENDVILRSSVTGNSPQEKSTSDEGVNYQTINASTIHFKLSFTVGCKIGYISYTLGNTVQEFHIFTSLAIQTPTTDTQFKEDATFSASGLVLRATDEVGFTKDFTTGFKFGTEEGDDSYTGASLSTPGTYTVYVTLTIDGISKSVTYDIVVTEVPTYTLVDDLSDLYEGARVIIVYDDYAAGAYGSKYLERSEQITFTDGAVTDAKDATEFTIRIYGEKIAFQFGEYYLSYSGSTNQIQRVTTLDDTCGFYDDSVGLLSNEEGRYLEYCSSLTPAGFACVAENFGSHVSLYVSDKAPETDALAADTFAYRYLHMRDYNIGNNSCLSTSKGGLGYFDTAVTAYTALDPDVKTEFKKNTDAVARFNAWAIANGKTINLDNGTVTAISSRILTSLGLTAESTSASLIVIIVSSISVAAVGGYFFLRKKKEQ